MWHCVLWNVVLSRHRSLPGVSDLAVACRWLTGGMRLWMWGDQPTSQVGWDVKKIINRRLQRLAAGKHRSQAIRQRGHQLLCLLIRASLYSKLLWLTLVADPGIAGGCITPSTPSLSVLSLPLFLPFSFPLCPVTSLGALPLRPYPCRLNPAIGAGGSAVSGIRQPSAFWCIFTWK